jgi:tRNA modification GTPase
MPLHLVDTAGLRQSADVTTDPVEAEGIRRARAEMARADRVLFVIDAAADPAGHAWIEERTAQPESVPVTVFFNKSDIADIVAGSAIAALPGAAAVLCGSAHTQAGLAELREHLKACMGYDGADAGAATARLRHVETLGRAREHAEAAFTQLVERRAGELVAEELRAAQRHLDDITGEFHADDLLGRIFGSFCIGK